MSNRAWDADGHRDADLHPHADTGAAPRLCREEDESDVIADAGSVVDRRSDEHRAHRTRREREPPRRDRQNDGAVALHDNVRPSVEVECEPGRPCLDDGDRPARVRDGDRLDGGAGERDLRRRRGQ
jgi:hypothetical protein